MPTTRPRLVTRDKHVTPEKLSLAKRLRREMTPPERRLWAAIRRNAIDGFHFRRQQVIAEYVVDFYCASAKLAIELDGATHENREWYDEARDRAIARLGVRVLRIPNEAMLDVEMVVELIRSELCAIAGPNP